MPTPTLRPQGLTWPLLAWVAAQPRLPAAAIDTLTRVSMVPVRRVMARREDLPVSATQRLVTDPNPVVRREAVATLRDQSWLRELLTSPAPQMRAALAANPAVGTSDLLRLTEFGPSRDLSPADARVAQAALTNPSLPLERARELLTMAPARLWGSQSRAGIVLLAARVLTAHPAARRDLACSDVPAVSATAARWAPPAALTQNDPNELGHFVEVLCARAGKGGSGATALTDAAAANPCLPDLPLGERYARRREKLLSGLGGDAAAAAVCDPDRHLDLIRLGSLTVDALLVEQDLEPAHALALAARHRPKSGLDVLARLVSRQGPAAMAAIRVGLSATDLRAAGPFDPLFAAAEQMSWAPLTWIGRSTDLLSGNATLTSADLPTLRSVAASGTRLLDGSDVHEQVSTAVAMLGEDPQVWQTLVALIEQDHRGSLGEVASTARFLHLPAPGRTSA